MKSILNDIKNNFYRDYKIYLVIIIVAFIFNFICANIFQSPSDSESLVIYSNYNFSEDDKNEINELFYDSIKNLEIYYDPLIDTTRFGTTGLMLADIFILKEESLNYIVSDLSDIVIKIDSNVIEEIGLENIEVSDSFYSIKITPNSIFSQQYKIDENFYILINKNSSNIGKYGTDNTHREVFELFNYWLREA